MEEAQVTVDGTTYSLPKPFMVMATQNPIEMEGTYPLPEAQRDRFMARISMGYPSARSELDMLDLHGGVSPLEDLQPVTDAATVSSMVAGGARGARLPVGAAVHRRPHPRDPLELAPCGWAPRRAPRCTCCAPRGPTPRWPGATTCSPTTCSRSPCPVLAHRLIPTGETQMARRTTADVVGDLLQRVRVPAPTR